MTKKKILVAVVTRERPKMFDALLDNLVLLDLPPETELEFCFVENAPVLSIKKRVQSFSAASGWPAIALHEPAQGIPFARNAAIHFATRTGADFLTFIDDDERASKIWLAALYSDVEERQLDLVGGPVAPEATIDTLTTAETLVLRGLRARAKRVAGTNSRLHLKNRDQDVTIITNNWLCRMKFLHHAQILFDETLGYSGGSDTAFFRAAKTSGAKTGWVPKAVVFEEIPKERLAFGYQFLRGRDQAISHYRVRYQDTLNVRLLAKSVIFILSKITLGLIRIIFAVFTRGESLVLAVRAFGFAWGRILAVMGQTSRHYEKVRGY